MGKFITRTITIGVVLCGICFVTCNFYDATNIEDTPTNKINQNNNMLSMMLETDSGSGQYEMTSLSSWPTNGYVFNEQMSKCEQGSILRWDDANKKVIMEGNVSDKCYVFFDKYNPIKINSYSITPNGNKITISISATSGTGTIAKYFYSKDDGASYVESTSNTYTFTNLANGTYKIKAYVLDSNNKISEFITKNIEITSMRLSEYIMSQYTGTQGENNIYYHDANLTNGAGDNSYRFAGANPNNYICLGSSEATCPEDNLYRIIGLFGDNNHGLTGQQLVKVIKNTSYGSFGWGNEKLKNWSSSSLNKTINTTFVTEKLHGIENKIADVSWKVSGIRLKKGSGLPSEASPNTVKTYYPEEITNATITYNAKIGLMYISDYGYATMYDYWTTGLSEYSKGAKNIDWLYLGGTEWLISPLTSPYNDIFEGAASIEDDGSLVFSRNLSYSYNVRPTFYFISSVNYISGDGTKNSPIRIN